MAKAKESGDALKLLKTKLEERKVLFGKDKVMKELKSKHLKQVFLASNCPPAIKESIVYYAGLSGTAVTALEQNSEEIGVFCKKNFFVSVLGIIGE